MKTVTLVQEPRHEPKATGDTRVCECAAKEVENGKDPGKCKCKKLDGEGICVTTRRIARERGILRGCEAHA